MYYPLLELVRTIKLQLYGYLSLVSNMKRETNTNTLKLKQPSFKSIPDLLSRWFYFFMFLSRYFSDYIHILFSLFKVKRNIEKWRQEMLVETRNRWSGCVLMYRDKLTVKYQLEIVEKTPRRSRLLV